MAKPATELQITLAEDAWHLTDRRTWLLAQLAELDELHRHAIALAATYGVSQKSLAVLCDVSGPRISQIVSSTDLPAGSIESFHQAVSGILERRQEPVQRTEPEDIAAWNKKFAVSRGITPTEPMPTREKPS
jgi:DNA-binding transcriptional regulator YdaS (Cro superfamily)